MRRHFPIVVSRHLQASPGLGEAPLAHSASLWKMVRMVAPPVESAPDNEVPSRLDIEAQAHVDPRTTQRSSGWRRQLLLPLRYSYWGCGGPSARWGFEDSYPVMLRENLPQEDWQYAISRINAGYIGSVWPKIVWAPFFFFMVVGAIVEGAARTDDIATSPIPGGIAMAILTTTGLLTSLLLSKVSHALLKRDLRRIATTCSVLTEQFRENSVTFDLNIRHVGARMEARLDIKLHVPDVAIEHVILNVAEYTGVEDKHLVHIDSSGERTVVYSTDRTRPMRDLGAGVVHRYGFGTVESSDEESEEEDENGNPVMKRQKFLTPHGGFCGCKEETRLAAEGWHKATEGPHKTTIFVWRNQHFKSCHACKLPVFDRDAHWYTKARQNDLFLLKQHADVYSSQASNA